MTSIGETLRRERLRRSLELEAIANELKISLRFLQSIENDQFDKLPGGVFAKSFVRQYAKYLGLNDTEMANEVQKIIEPPPLPDVPEGQKPPDTLIDVPRMSEWESVGDSRSWSSSLPALAMVVVVMLVCSGVYAWWQRSRRPAAPQEISTVQTAQPPQVAQPSPQPMEQPAAQTPPQPGVPATQIPEQPVPVSRQPQPQTAERSQQNSADRPAPEALSAQPSAAAPPPPGVTRTVTGRPGGPVKVEITASDLTWVGARSDGEMTFSGTLEPNQSRTIEGKQTVSLRLGNAGGVNITLNGKPIGPVGPKGQVRMVQLTSGGFQIVAPAPKPVAPDDRF